MTTSPVLTEDSGFLADDLIASLGGPRNAASDSLGGKGARLDELIRQGLPVPPGFCVTAGTLKHFLTETGLDAQVRNADRSSVRTAITAAKIPPGIATAILDAYADLGSPRVAVRSSAIGEDAGEQSYAGQHDTMLDVAGESEVLEAVKACWASLWSDRAAAYRAAGAGNVRGMAVVVQQMIPAEASGVLFTMDPVSGRPHRLVIEACQGLGEGLVSGRVSSDSFVVDDRSMQVVEENVRYKVTRYTTVAPGKVALAKVDQGARNAPCLDSDRLHELAWLSIGIRDRAGCEQDIEWSLAGGQLWILQARPITTTAGGAGEESPYLEPQFDSVERGTLWSRMDIGEIFVGAMTPLGLSFARHHQKHVHGACATAVGVRDVGDHVGYMGYLQGHVYLNVSYTAYILSQCLPTRDQHHFTSRFASEEVDLADYRNPFGVFPAGNRETTQWLRVTARELTRMKRRAEEMTDARLKEFDRVRRIDFTRLGRYELHAELSRYLVHYRDMHVGYMPYYINAFSAYGLLVELCGQWLPDAGENLQNRIKTDMSNLRTVATAREMRQLARSAAAWPAVVGLIRETPVDGIEEALRADPDGRAFWDAHMEPFLRVNGVRGRQEMELTHPRWVDDPSYIFQMIRRYTDEGSSPDDLLYREDLRIDAASLLAGLPRLKRMILELVLWLYRTCSELREVARMAMITSLWMIRTVIYELGRRLVEAGQLRSIEEVAYLDLEDVRRYLAGHAEAEEAFDRGRIDQVRQLHEYQRRLPEPPLSFIGTYDVTKPARTAVPTDGVAGVPASPGKVSGKARIVEDLVWQADEFQAGEILVTKYTDASWTPLFAIAAGIVTDIGSMLSHSSIVAREFGIPSVVNAKNATQRINTGDLITVDGDTGAVTILERHGPHPAGPAGRPEGGLGA